MWTTLPAPFACEFGEEFGSCVNWAIFLSAWSLAALSVPSSQFALETRDPGLRLLFSRPAGIGGARNLGPLPQGKYSQRQAPQQQYSRNPGYVALHGVNLPVQIADEKWLPLSSRLYHSRGLCVRHLQGEFAAPEGTGTGGR